MVSSLSAIQGSLIGGAIGDALGSPVEFLRWNDIKKHYGDAGIQRLEMDFEQGLALISDDTQMTLFTANGLLMYESYRAASSEVPAPEQCIYDAYRDWYRCQCSRGIPRNNHSWLSDLPEMHEYRAPGITCLNALKANKAGSIANPINGSKGCGGIMRVAPVALWGFNKRSIEAIDLLAAEAAALTHGHPLGYMSAAALADVISRLLKGDVDMYDAVAACRESMCVLFRENEYLDELLRMIDLPVRLSKNDRADVENIHEIGEGWTGEEALGIALYCSLKYQNDFSGAVVAAVNHNGDSDSTGAIVGNIVGAKVGMEGIEGRWLRGLELKNTLLEMAQDLYDGCPADAESAITKEAWNQKYNIACQN